MPAGKLVNRSPVETWECQAVQHAQRCKVDSPLGNPPQLGQTAISVVRVLAVCYRETALQHS